MEQTIRWSIRAPWGREWDRYRKLLREAGLPLQGVDAASGRLFLVAVDAAGRVGGGAGVEGLGPLVLLRSLVVAASHRKKGVGSALLEAAEQAAGESGAHRIFLLTTTAAAFFHRRGYRSMPRRDAPDPIRASHEFALLCPASASLMVKNLAERPNDRERDCRVH